eukprot:7286016-Heterocapsa_arctica.AAC.1
MCLHFAYLTRTAFDEGLEAKIEAMPPMDVKDIFKSVEPYWLAQQAWQAAGAPPLKAPARRGSCLLNFDM